MIDTKMDFFYTSSKGNLKTWSSMYTLFFFLIASLSIFGAESQVDLRIDSNPLIPNQRSSLNVTSTNFVDFMEGKHGALLTPEMTFHVNGNTDFSVTMAHRHKFKNVVWGHSVFLDRTHLDFCQLDQVGTGLDLLTNFFDVRLNYYHPLTRFKYPIIFPNRWVDSEVFFKTKFFGVGTGPLYNIDTKTWALHSRIVVPLKTFSIHLGALCGSGPWADSKAVLSVSFHLFRPKTMNRMATPASHLQRSSFYYTSAYVPPELVQKVAPWPVRKSYAKSISPLSAEKYLDFVEETITLQPKREGDLGD